MPGNEKNPLRRVFYGLIQAEKAGLTLAEHDTTFA